MHRSSLLGLGLLALVAAGCDDKAPSAPAAEKITVDPSDVARLNMRFGDRLASELGVPARTAVARPAVVSDKAALHRDLVHHNGRLVPTAPVLPTRAKPLVRGGAR
jgi:hypothetical protein